jgi:hypothetical protein
LEAEEKQESQHDKSQRGAEIAVTAGISGLKVRIVNLRQGTPFPSGIAPENRGRRNACMAAERRHALANPLESGKEWRGTLEGWSETWPGRYHP